MGRLPRWVGTELGPVARWLEAVSTKSGKVVVGFSCPEYLTARLIRFI